jgi:hypothetical protein
VQILIIPFFLIVWLLIFWIGSIFLEATGMERAVARFQTLSALTGAGFTTTQSELIVEHKTRRKIISYLIFLGNTGIMAFILLVILYTRMGISAFSNFAVWIIIAFLIIIFGSLRLGIINSISDKLVIAVKKKKLKASAFREIVLKQTGENVLAYLFIEQQPNSANLTLENIRSEYKNATVLAVERDNQLLLNFCDNEKLKVNDQLLCYLRKDSQDL